MIFREEYGKKNFIGIKKIPYISSQVIRGIYSRSIMYVFTSMILASVAYSQQNKAEIILLAESCSDKLDRGLLDSSCLLLGIYAKRRAQGRGFYNQMENICLNWLSEVQEMEFQDYLEPFYKYYPKCWYIFEQQNRNTKSLEQTSYKSLIKDFYSY